MKPALARERAGKPCPSGKNASPDSHYHTATARQIQLQLKMRNSDETLNGAAPKNVDSGAIAL